MPGSIQISDIQPPVTPPLFLQVTVGKREYSGNIGQDGFSFPVTSLRDSMVMTLYDAGKDLVSKTEVNTRAIVELGTMDAVFSLDSGGAIILQLRFLLSDEDRKRIQEMRNSVVKRKQQELLGNGHELYFQEQAEEISDIASKGDHLMLRKSMKLDDLKERDASSVVSVALPNEHSEEISDIASKGDQLTLRKSLSLDDLKDSYVPSVASLGSRAIGSNDLVLEGPIDIDSKKGQGKESRLSSAVKKMITAFESSSPQAPHSIPRIKSESSLEGVSVSSETSTNSSIKPHTSGASLSMQRDLSAGTSGKVTITSADTVSSSRSGKQVMFGKKKPATSRQTGVSSTSESRRRSSSRRERTAKTSMGDNDLIRSAEKHRSRSIGAYLPEQQQTDRLAAASSITWIHPHVCITTASRQLRNLVDLEHLNSVRNIEPNAREETKENKSGDDMRDAAFSARQSPVLNGWLINQGVRAVIVVIACGAVFFNNR
ncbi:uncharacterized protein [Lolium perenne]|uniref:uncharacterized protein isoform X2 n=1 Tax=Lolium perenne TaxID=4522 RepID=UPI0021F64B19|nr:uncharacterized protein LOC127327904 isoform X2 [Lolium perenne]